MNILLDALTLPAIVTGIFWLQHRLSPWHKRRARHEAFAGTAILAVILGVSFASPHMRITKCDNFKTWKDCAIIVLTGQIQQSDGAEFVERTKEISKARIDLDGPGGSTIAGLVIGERIHEKGFNTNVPPGTVCMSSCANIWIAGAHRDLGMKALLLWHPAFRWDDPNNADGEANLLVGIYFAHLGYTYADATKMFGHSPNDFYGAFNNEGKLVTHMKHWNGTDFVDMEQ